MEARSVDQRALAAARAVAVEHGVPCERATVINSGSNVMVHLRPSPVVARVMTGTVALHDDPQRWLRREVEVLSFLAPSDIAIAPSASIDPGPYRSAGLWMTFWQLVGDRGRADLDAGAERLGRVLRELHDELLGFPGELPGLLDLRHDIERLLGLLRPTAGLGAGRLRSLEERLLALSEAVFESSLPAQPLHGDASLWNLIGGPSGRLVWNDFEDACRGPVHWDVAGYLISLQLNGADPAFVARALDAYGGLDADELAPFTAAHGVYDEVWRLYDAQRRAPEEEGGPSSDASSYDV